MRIPALIMLFVAVGCTGDQSGASTANSDQADAAAGRPDDGSTAAGRVTLRRLNAREYDNTIRDLVGLDLKPSASQQFPADEWGDGFDNDGDVLTTSPLASEKYLAAAQLVAQSALANPTARAKLVPCTLGGATENECASSVVMEFARRAFRRPVTADEVAPYLTLVELAKSLGDTVDVGVGLALAAVLTSPDFLFLVEADPTPGVVRPLTSFEFASRLSYFIWSSMPDESLFQSAGKGTLLQTSEIATQVKRMLADPKASAFADVLATDWMQTVSLQYAKPDVSLFPTWSESLKRAMEQELRLFLAPIVSGQAPATDLLAANYTYANRELANFYGLPSASLTDQFQRVELDPSRRGGVLRQGSFLVLTSHPDRNSPTRRGKWILERLLCSPPSPPPANVPALDPNVPFEGSLRQRMQQVHQKAGIACAGCHAVIDPMGFALENYDAIGLWRDKDGKYPIDATGTMPGTGVPFNGPAELSKAIVADSRFPACVAKQLLTFALGRHTTDADGPLIDSLGAQFVQAGSRLPRLTELVATSVPMLSRQTETQ